MEQIAVSLNSALEMEESIQKIEAKLEGKSYSELLIHLYSGMEDTNLVSVVVGRMAEEFPDAVIVGTLSAGEILDGRVNEKGITASVIIFDTTKVQVIRCDNVKGNEKSVGQKICRETAKLENLKAVELLLPGTEFTTRAIFDELKNIDSGVEVFGGYSGGHQLERSEHYVYNPEGIDYDAVYAIAYYGKDFHIQVRKSAGWQKLGMPFRVTKADENRLIEIDDAPAVDIYEKYLQIDRNDNFAEETFEFPLVAGMDGEELLRHTITVEKDGTLVLAGYVTEGMDIYLSFGNPTDIVEKVNHRLREVAEFNPEVILLYSCSVRKSFWESFANIELEPFEKIANTSGFYTWGEVKRNQTTGRLYEYNITMLSIAMREGDAEPLEGEFRVDDSVLKGQASLLKRLSKLVAATTGELQKAYMDLSILNSKLAIMADYDNLTGMFNRRKIEERINTHLDNARDTGNSMGLIMLDIDHFKNVNDTYGHGIGDEVLKKLGEICIKNTREKKGNLGRWGGEEFFIALPRVNEKETYEFAESLRKQIESAKFPCVEKLTISLGVIVATGKEDRKELYTKVDNALYTAKQNGRNQTVISK